MVNVLINGALGRMGKKVYDACLISDLVKPVCGVDIYENKSNPDFPVYSSFAQVTEKVDVVIDFSASVSLNGILEYCIPNGIPAVLCATGYNESDVAKVKNASEKIAIFRSANMSLGVNILIELVKKASQALYGFDVEIIEKHHNQKKDAPSGTALMLADAVKEILPQKYYTYGREGMVGARDKNEIGIHAIRGGNIVGDHDVLFAGLSETITLSHQATDRAVFAEGAVKAAVYIATKNNGLYNMSDMINGK